MEKEPPASSTREYVTMRPGPAEEGRGSGKPGRGPVCLQMSAGRNDDGSTVRRVRYYRPIISGGRHSNRKKLVSEKKHWKNMTFIFFFYFS